MPTFQKCGPAVTEMANSILCEFPSHKPVLDARVKIDFLFAYCDRDDAGQPKNHAIRYRGGRALGVCRKIKLKDRVAGRGDVEITLDGDWWDTASEADQRGLLDHEMHHISVEVDSNGKAVTDDITRPKITMRKHDFEFGWFGIIAARHGKASQEVKQATQMMEQGGQFLFPDFWHAPAGAE